MLNNIADKVENWITMPNSAFSTLYGTLCINSYRQARHYHGIEIYRLIMFALYSLNQLATKTITSNTRPTNVSTITMSV